MSRNDAGMVLPSALVFLGALVLLGTTAVLVTTTEMKVGGNYKISEQAFYVAQAGCEEARARLRANAAHPIDDPYPTQAQWRGYMGNVVGAEDKGYDSGKTMHVRYDSLLPDLGYIVEIKHQTDNAGKVLYWGDSNGDGVSERNTTTGENIFAVTSYGSAAGSSKAIGVEVARVPTITVPSALYVEATTTVHGSDTYLDGTDSCGGTDKPGIVSTESPGSIAISGGPRIQGVGGSEPNIVYNATNMNVQSLIDSFKGVAHFSYVVDSATHAATNTPGPGDGWGNPTPGATLQDPSSCSTSKMVYYDTSGTFVKLVGVSGCGILLVEGDLEIEGDFSWYGPVIVAGSVIFTGGGNKNITGALIAGQSAVVGVAGGDTSIAYCSAAISDHTENRPLLLLSWKEDI